MQCKLSLRGLIVLVALSGIMSQAVQAATADSIIENAKQSNAPLGQLVELDRTPFRIDPIRCLMGTYCIAHRLKICSRPGIGYPTHWSRNPYCNCRQTDHPC